MIKKTALFSCLFFLVILFYSSCGLSRLSSAWKRVDKETVVASKNFEEKIKFRWNEFIYIPVTMNDEKMSREFVFDTGSPSFITFKTRNELNIKSEKVVNKPLRIDYCAVPGKIGKVNYTKIGCIVMDYSNPRIEGVAGVTLMKNQMCTISFFDSTITVTDKPDFIKPNFKGTRIDFKPLGPEQQTPLVKLIVNGTDTIEAMIDTGYPGFLKLNSSFNIGKIRPGNIATYTYKNDGPADRKHKDSTVLEQDVKLDLLKMDGWEGRNMVADRSDNYDGRNLLGLSFLKNFVVTFDWIHNYIYLQPATTAATFNEQSFGFKCDTVDAKLIVTAVVKKSFAEIEKLHPGDEIEMINNIPVATINKNLIQLINDGALTNNLIVLKVKNNPTSIELKKYDLFSK